MDTEQGLGYDGWCSIHSNHADCVQNGACEWVTDVRALEHENEILLNQVNTEQENCQSYACTLCIAHEGPAFWPNLDSWHRTARLRLVLLP